MNSEQGIFSICIKSSASLCSSGLALTFFDTKMEESTKSKFEYFYHSIILRISFIRDTQHPDINFNKISYTIHKAYRGSTSMLQDSKNILHEILANRA